MKALEEWPSFDPGTERVSLLQWVEEILTEDEYEREEAS